MAKFDHFETAFRITLNIEGDGELSDDRLDPGGQTFSGISRVYWPDWDGWPLVDAWIETGEKSHLLDVMVRRFYLVNFWNRIQGDKLAEMAPAIAYELFDTAVNVDVVDAVRFLQIGYNVARGTYWEDLVVDGNLGPKTLKTISNYLVSRPGTPDVNTEILLNCMNGEQYIFYKGHPHLKNFRGVYRRV